MAAVHRRTSYEGAQFGSINSLSREGNSLRIGELFVVL